MLFKSPQNGQNWTIIWTFVYLHDKMITLLNITKTSITKTSETAKLL